MTWSPLLAVPLLAFTFGNCSRADDLAWQRFNSDDEVSLSVTAEAELGPPVVGELVSTTGETIVGTVTIDPGSGPVGTEHRVVVDIGRAWEERVGRVEIEAVTEERGSRFLPLVQDSASAGVWVLDLRSYGVDGEARTDTFRVLLYELVEVVDAEEI